MTIFETLEEIFSHITVPQNLQRKVALVKSRVSALEQKDSDRGALIISRLKTKLKEAEIQNREQQAANKVSIAEFLRPEQGIAKPSPRVIMGRRNPITSRR